MKTNPFFAAVVLATAFLATGAVGQTSDQTTPPAAPATAPSPPAMAPSQMPTPNVIIYIPQLPNPTELANAATAQGLAIDKMVQTSTQIIVVYKYANGQTNTVAYQLLPVAGAAPGAAPVAPAASPTVVPAATTTVVYAAPGYYYDPYYYSPWPWPWFAPVSVGIGFGYYHGGGYGFRGGWGGFHR